MDKSSVECVKIERVFCFMPLHERPTQAGASETIPSPYLSVQSSLLGQRTQLRLALAARGMQACSAVGADPTSCEDSL